MFSPHNTLSRYRPTPERFQVCSIATDQALMDARWYRANNAWDHTQQHSSPYAKAIKAAILLHGFAGEQTEGGLLDQLAHTLAERGIHAITYNARGIGKSSGTYSETPIAEHVNDLRGVTRWAEQTLNIPHTQICPIGFSLGSAIVGLSLLQGANYGGVVYLSPGTRPALSMWPRYQSPIIWDEIRRSGKYTKPGASVPIGAQNLYDLRDTDLGEECFIIDRPLLIIHGTADSRIPVHFSEHAANFARKNSDNQTTLVTLPGASHSFRPHADFVPLVENQILDWAFSLI